jgi:hypothetical protein
MAAILLSVYTSPVLGSRPERRLLQERVCPCVWRSIRRSSVLDPGQQNLWRAMRIESVHQPGSSPPLPRCERFTGSGAERTRGFFLTTSCSGYGISRFVVYRKVRAVSSRQLLPLVFFLFLRRGIIDTNTMRGGSPPLHSIIFFLIVHY